MRTVAAVVDEGARTFDRGHPLRGLRARPLRRRPV